MRYQVRAPERGRARRCVRGEKSLIRAGQPKPSGKQTHLSNTPFISATELWRNAVRDELSLVEAVFMIVSPLRVDI
jgi:hypothetical protein